MRFVCSCSRRLRGQMPGLGAPSRAYSKITTFSYAIGLFLPRRLQGQIPGFGAPSRAYLKIATLPYAIRLFLLSAPPGPESRILSPLPGLLKKCYFPLCDSPVPALGASGARFRDLEPPPQLT